MMERYQDLGGKSTVSRYEIGLDSITVQFKDNSEYLYSYTSAGREHIENMKKLAVAGRGLDSYILLNVRKKYLVKLR